MYLVELDIKSGLLSMDVTNDSWMGIKCFKKLYEKKGIEALTVVALTADYLSVLSHYPENDRFIRSLEEVYGDRMKLKINDELIKECLSKYKQLQFNPDLEQERIFKEIKIRILESMSRANQEENDIDIAKYTKELQRHEETMNSFSTRFNKKEAVSNAVTSNGYILSRIENDILSRKKSKFVNHDEKFENPNKLNLEN